jgi:hypothetical protein
MTRIIWRIRQSYFRWILSRDKTLKDISNRIARARKSHGPVTHLYQAQARRVNELLRGVS